MSNEHASWGFSEGDRIAPGREAVELLGGGTRYEAYLARDERLRTLVVAKLVRPDQASDPVALRAVAAEASMLGRLAHPMLVRSFGAELEGERPQLLLEHLDGFRLSTLIRRFGVSLEQLLPLALDMCSVLHYLAGERVVHLDVKPRNIVMGDRPRLIDLSIARDVDRLAEIGEPIGTDAYMAPEQCDPELFHELGSAADVWGLGVTLHEALAGEHPFPAGSERFPQLYVDPRGLDGRMPHQLRHVVRACLERSPADRPAAGEVADVIEPLQDQLPPPQIGRFRPRARQLQDSVQFRA